MKKILFLLLILLPSFVHALEEPKLHSEYAIVYDLKEDKVIYSKRAEEQISIASLTKIMTTITAINNISDLNERVIITQDMLNQVRYDASRAGLNVGDVVTYKDLLYASILPSGADATTSLAISLTGSISNFVSKMNEEKDALGLENTHFKNVTGLDEKGQYSTVSDVLTILKYALENETFKEIYKTKEYTLTNGLKVKSTIYNYSKNLNKDTSRIIGSKTGFTAEAGLCISSLFETNNHEMLLITTNAPYGTGYNIEDALYLINYMDTNYQDVTLSTKNTFLKKLNVSDSNIDSYDIITSLDAVKYLPKDYDINNFKVEYNGLDNLTYKVKENTEIGIISYYYANELIASEKVYLKTTIKKDYIKIIKHYKLHYFLITILCIVCLIIIGKKLTKKKLGVR